jgi:hypothetical protein
MAGAGRKFKGDNTSVNRLRSDLDPSSVRRCEPFNGSRPIETEGGYRASALLRSTRKCAA